MKIVVDVDNTLYEANELFTHVASEHFDINLPEISRNWHDYTTVAAPSVLHNIFRKAHSREYVEKQEPYPNSASTLRWAADKNHRIFFISDRHAQVRRTLIDWLKDHEFPVRSEEDVLTSNDKRAWMKEIKPDIVIDDRVRTIVYASQQLRATVFALETTWNMNLRGEVPNVHVCQNWQEIAVKLDTLI